jgi:elongation factor P--(R)-beta-lysine ligase
MAEREPPALRLVRHPRAAELVARRAALLAALRAHLDGRGLLEADVPALLPHAGQEAHLQPPAVTLAGLPGPLWLQTSPELCLKRLLCAGVPAVYALGAAYRAGREELSRRHQPQFCMLEWYRPGVDIADLVADVRALGAAAAAALGVAAPPAGRVVSVTRALEEFAGVELDALLAGADPPRAFDRVLVERIEPALAAQEGWVFLHGYPAFGAALARLSPDDPRLALRVEAYLHGIEIANGYVELADADEHRRRWAAERSAREPSSPAAPVDEGFLADLRAPGLPECVGMALGVDRLMLALLGAESLADVLPFRLELQG